MDWSTQRRIPVDKTVHIIGEEKFAPDEFFSMTCRFTPRRTRVHQSSSVTWNNTTTDGHIVSVDFKVSSAAARFDSVGDSVMVAPHCVGLPTSVSYVISALPGTTLDYMCAVHPWMQGSTHVVGSGDSTDD